MALRAELKTFAPLRLCVNQIPSSGRAAFHGQGELTARTF
jgi:hypothetical protein